MKYQKIINLLDNKSNKRSKFSIKNWVEINYDSHGVYSIGSQIKLKNMMLKPNLCNYSDLYILVSGEITITGGSNDATDANKPKYKRNKEVIFLIVHHLLNAQVKKMIP